jgi:hypothetical protein
MFILLIILVLTVVYYQCRRALPKAISEAVIESMSKAVTNPPSLLQFTNNPIDWQKLKASAMAARVARREELERMDTEESKAELALMNAEDEHDAARAARHYPPDIITYSNSVTPQDCLVCVRKEPSTNTWEAYERKNAMAKIGASIWLHTAVPYGTEDIRVMYSIRRVDTPARWERHTHYHRHNEKMESFSQQHTEDHDAAIAAKHFPTRKSFISFTITENEQNVLYRTKTVDEIRNFMRIHADATIGSLIPFFEGTLQNDHGIRVIYAIHRVDKPERWEEHLYMFRLNERVSHY